jgi:protein Mpv17
MATEKKQPKREVKVQEPSPIPKLCLMAVFLSGIADAIAQNTDLLASVAGVSSAKAVFKLDFSRLARFIFYGVFMTPIGFKWVSLLNYLFPMPESKVIKTSEKTEKVIEPSTVDVFQVVTKRVIMDQVVYSPFSVAFFFVGMGYLEGSSWVEIYSKLTEVNYSLYIS